MSAAFMTKCDFDVINDHSTLRLNTKIKNLNDKEFQVQAFNLHNAEHFWKLYVHYEIELLKHSIILNM